MILKIICLSFTLLYFWYFYSFFSTPPPKPGTPAAPKASVPFELHFIPQSHTQFLFFSEGSMFWEHTFPNEDLYWIHLADEKMIEHNACQTFPTPIQIPAQGWNLYNFVKKNPSVQKLGPFIEDTPYTVQEGNVFFFDCDKRHIQNLSQCPSGSLFQNHHCVEITSCTGQPNGIDIPHLTDVTKYIRCSNGREFTRDCPKDHFFYHDTCVSKNDLVHVCQFHDTIQPIQLDDWTLFECRDHKPIHTTCMPGTRLSSKLECEPDDCVGRADYERVPMDKRYLDSFYFIPGYTTCWKEKIYQTAECLQNWDDRLTKGDNTTFLPTVFDPQLKECAVPTFCENFWSTDPDSIVPAHEFTKHVRNWKGSELYDTAVGYTCTGGNVRKRKLVDPEKRISKRFKEEPACGQPHFLLPVAEHPDRYYDCYQNQITLCASGEYFNGVSCEKIPETAHQYKNVPLFHFEPSGSDDWMHPFEYAGGQPLLQSCQNASFEYWKLYDVCVHTECKNYAFLAMVPQLSLLLPPPSRFKCVYDETDRHVKKEGPVDVAYTFWDQKIGPEGVTRSDTCTFGQTLQTGHFIWDSTVFATCDWNQPFVFCPFKSGRGIMEIDRSKSIYACVPPATNLIHHTKTTQTHPQDPWTSYRTNAVKRILPPIWDGQPYYFHLNKGDKTLYVLPETGFEVPEDTRLTLYVNRPVDLELRYRVTHPPNVAFRYKDVTNDLEPIFSDPREGYLIRVKHFTKEHLNIPTYTVQTHMDAFSVNYNP